MKRNQMIAIAAAAVLTSGGLWAYGGPGQGCPQNGGYGKGMMQPDRMGQQDPRDGMLTGIVFSLDLNDAQRESIEKLMVERRYKMRELYKNSSPMAALKAALSEKGFDKSVYLEGAKAKRETMMELRAEYLVKMVDILEPKQRLELKKKLEEMPQWGKRGFGKK